MDTVFVCRSTGSVPARWLAKTPESLACLVSDDIENLRQAGLKETRGDVRCVIYGHLIRLSVWNLRHDWDKTKPVREKTALITAKIAEFGGLGAVEKYLEERTGTPALARAAFVREKSARYGADDNEISF